MSPPFKNCFDLLQYSQPPVMFELIATSRIGGPLFLTVGTRDAVSVGLAKGILTLGHRRTFTLEPTLFCAEHEMETDRYCSFWKNCSASSGVTVHCPAENAILPN